MFLCLNERKEGYCYAFFLFDHARTLIVWQQGSAVVHRREEPTRLYDSGSACYVVNAHTSSIINHGWQSGASAFHS